VRKYFSQIVVCDFEYEIADGGLPNVLCMVAYVLDQYLRHVRTIQLWRGVVGQPLPPIHLYRGEFGKIPPFDIGPDTLFVAYSAWAEMTCFQVLGWKFPVHVFDQHTAYLAASNILLPYNPDEKRSRQSKKLSDACRAYGIEGWEHIDKKSIAEDIGNGLWQKYGKDGVFAYCEEDVKKSTELLRAQLRDRCDYRGRVSLPAADTERVLHWSNYSAKSIALIQARGMPIDVVLWSLVQENKQAVIGELLRRFDPSYGDDEPIYSPDGDWSYARFERWLVRRGVYAWPRLETGRLDIDSDAFRLMYHVPGIEGLHALRDTIGFISKARLPIGPDGRNRPSLFPFGTATGRNAHAKSPYNAHAAVRSFMLFPPGSIGAYLDWRTQEVGIAAVWSDDQALKDDYAAGDIYHSLALKCGLTTETDRVRWKKENPAMRDRMKKLQLGVNYGMGVPALARGLDRHPLIASAIIEQHKRTYPPFWECRANMVMNAMLDRRIESRFGWPLRLTTRPNKRTLYNFPMQSGGAEMLRLAAWRLCEAGIVPIMLIHDGILFEETNPEKIELAHEIMLQAGRDVCDGFEIGVDTDQMLIGANHAGGARYYDKRPMAKKLWATIMDTLEAIGAIPKRGAA
jgi:DNA polymerase-1